MPPKLVFRHIVQIYILGFLIYFLSYYNVFKKKKKKGALLLSEPHCQMYQLLTL